MPLSTRYLKVLWTLNLQGILQTQKKKVTLAHVFIFTTHTHTHTHTHTLSHTFLKNCDIYVLCGKKFLLLFSDQVMSKSLRPHGLQQARLPCLSVSQSLLRFMSIESMMLSDHFILCFLLLPAVFPSIRVFFNELALYSFRISPSSEYSGLTSLRIDQFDLLAV